MTNIEVIQDMYAAFTRGDVAAILSHLTEDVSWESEGPEALAYTGLLRGHEGALKFFSALAAEHRVIEFKMTEFFERPDAVAAFGRYKIIMNATGKMVDTPVAHFFGFRDGKVSRYVNLGNTAAYVEALAA